MRHVREVPDTNHTGPVPSKFTYSTQNHKKKDDNVGEHDGETKQVRA